MKSPAPFVIALALVLAATTARAQDAAPCDSCASCTAALAVPRAHVSLERDLDAPGGGPCIDVRGEHAQLDGRGHLVHGSATVGVRIEGSATLVRNVRVSGTATGIEIAGGADATLYHDTLEARDTGIRVSASPGVRIHRVRVSGGRVGIAFGDVGADGRCAPGATVASPGAVVHASRVERAGTGLAACDALPVLTQDALVNNGTGLVLGAPAAAASGGEPARAPYDPCVCAPALSDVHQGTTLMYSSGCGSCQVHEGWLPALRASHHDVRARETGLANADVAQRFDDFVAHCAPEVTDVLGIPGCVPDYACVASRAVSKTRGASDALVVETPLESAEDVGRFAEACAAAAARDFQAGDRCVRHQLRGNTVCGNRAADIRLAPGASHAAGVDDACDTAEGWADEGAASGCARRCPRDLSAAALAPSADALPPLANPVPANVEPETRVPTARPAPPASAPQRVSVSAPSAARRPGARTRWLVTGAGVLAIAGLLAFVWRGQR